MITGHVWPFDTVDQPPPRPQPKLYSTKQTPRGSVVVLGDDLLTDEMTTEEAQRTADWLNHRKSA